MRVARRSNLEDPSPPYNLAAASYAYLLPPLSHCPPQSRHNKCIPGTPSASSSSCRSRWRGSSKHTGTVKPSSTRTKSNNNPNYRYITRVSRCPVPDFQHNQAKVIHTKCNPKCITCSHKLRRSNRCMRRSNKEGNYRLKNNIKRRSSHTHSLIVTSRCSTSNINGNNSNNNSSSNKNKNKHKKKKNNNKNKASWSRIIPRRPERLPQNGPAAWTGPW
mmetsp:Transcript_72555/g.158364  ORF Transcript_72555/g.158364 Transcript_72555/m.158364 type:complete len:218 (-) Transcript_72555:443-1096(-)